MTKQDRREAFIGAAVFMLVVALQAFAFAQAQKPITFAWNANPNPDNGQPVAGYTLLIDQQQTHQQQTVDAGNALTLIVPMAPGPYEATLKAYWADGTPSPYSQPIQFTVAAAESDPCLPPLGAHAPAIFPTSVSVTTGKPGSPSFVSFKLAGPDPVVEVAVQVDGLDQVPIATGTDLRAFGSLWFTQPAAGAHTLGIRVLTSFGCALVRPAPPLVVK